MCVASSCGDGVTVTGEECDGGEGCKADCTFLCTTDPATQCTGTPAVACQQFACAADHSCTTVPDASANGTGCDPDQPANVCVNGACQAPACGDGIIEAGEDCDGGDGCKADCTFLCVNDPDTECAGTGTPLACEKFGCTATHACTIVPDGTLNGQACDPAQPGNVCLNGTCVSLLDCGNNILDPGEQCDDGGLLNLDGCDSVCQFEEDHRISSLRQQFATDAFCPQNALGTAITVDAQPTIQATWDLPVSTGSLSVVFKFLGLQDLTGGDSPFTLGFVKATPAGRVLVDAPVCGNGVCEDSPDPLLVEAAFTCADDCIYDGNNDLDWWYVRDPASVDANETPIEQLSGQVSGGRVIAGPGNISLDLLFALQPARVQLFDAKVEALLDGAVNAPTVSTTGTPPGHLASEHLDPALVSVAGSSTGAMCSNVSAASLFDTPMPLLLQIVCTDPTGLIAAFTPANRLLDAFITGCLVFGLPGVVPTQPDGSRDGATYHFASDPLTGAVTSCTKDAQPALLTDCVNNATYSSYFHFSANRVIIKRN
jgi:cysteine-rich repeat protein